jgi:hypothetical protein
MKFHGLAPSSHQVVLAPATPNVTFDPERGAPVRSEIKVSILRGVTRSGAKVNRTEAGNRRPPLALGGHFFQHLARGRPFNAWEW